MKTEENRNKKLYIVLGLMVFVQLIFIIYGFHCKKGGYHSDELWSYGYANSYYQPYIFQDEDANLINVNEWVDGKELKDYIVVNKGETFKYDSVYNNQKYDLSPPLHTMILHTICSFFPGQFSKWFSFSINIVSFLLCMVFLFKTAKLLKDDMFALCCCAVYGFSLGARDTYIYLRMYGLCAAFTMIIIYNFVSYFTNVKKGNKIVNKYLAGMCIASLLAFLTHYYMIAMVGILTFITCIILLFQKKIKVMFLVGTSMLVTFIVAVLQQYTVFNVMQAQMTDIVEKEANYTFPLRFRIVSNFLMKKLFGIPVSMYKNKWVPIIVACIIFLLILSIPLLYLFRDTVFMKSIKRKVTFGFKNIKNLFKYLERRINWFFVTFFLVVIGQIIVVGETSNIYGMGVYLDRYLFAVFPLAVVVGLAFFYQVCIILLKKRKRCRYLVIGVSLLLIGVNLYNRSNDSIYYFGNPENETAISDAVKDRDCIYVMEEEWILTAVAPYLMDSKEFFRVSYLDYINYEDAFKEKLKREQVILLLDTSPYSSMFVGDNGDPVEVINGQWVNLRLLNEELLKFYEDIEPSTEMQKLGEQLVYGRRMEIYLINP